MKSLFPFLILVSTALAQPVPGLSWASRLATEGAPQEIRYGNGWYVGMLYSEGEEYWDYDEEMWEENYYTLYDNVVVRTQDGLSWTRHEISAGSRGQVRGLAHAGSTWLAVASDGQVYRSTNHAATWGEVGQLPVVVYEDTYGYEDEDGNWVEESYTYESRRYDPLHPVHLGGNTWLIIDGASGNVYRSTDNGANWSERGQTGQGMAFYDVVRGGGQLMVVGESGQIATSADDGATWAAQESGTGNTLVSVAYGNGRFVAVGQMNTVLTSIDGVNWQLQPTGGRRQWLSSVAFGDGVFVRADNGSVSGDGLVWTTPQWGGAAGSSVVYGQAGWLIVSGSYDGEGEVYQSVGGPVPEVEFYGNLPAGEVGQSYSYQITMDEWEVPATGYLALDLPSGLQFNEATGVLSGTPTVAGDYQITIYAGNENGYGSYQQISLTIYNQGAQPVPGLSWASRLATEGAPQEIRYGNGWYVGMLYSEGEEYWDYDEEMWEENYYTLYDNVVVRTQDGLSWTRHEISAGSRGQVRGLAHAGSTWLAVASDGQVYRSTNHAATWGEVGQLPVVVYEDTYGYEDEDGNWVEESYTYESRRYDPLHPVHLGGNTWLIIDGASGNVYRSTDNGANWSERGQTGQGMAFYDVVRGGGQLMVVGESGQIATSADDGATWAAQESGTGNTLVSVAYGNGRFVAVGQMNTVLTSIDGVNWQLQPTGGRRQWLSSVAFGDGVFVRADNGSVSGDGLVWTTPQWGGAAGSSVVYGQAGWLIVSGSYDGEGEVYQSVGGPVPEVEFYGNLPAGEVGQSYSYQITMDEWEVPATGYLALDLPSGLQFNEATGVLSGTPTVAGDYQITIYAGNENGYGSYQQISLTIYNQGGGSGDTKANQTLGAFPAVGAKTFGDAPFAVTLPSAGASGQPVVLSVKSGPATVSGNTVTLIGAGTVVLAANQAGNTNYNAAPEVTTSFTVSKANQTLGAFAAVGAKTFGDAPFAVTLPSAGASGQPVVLSVKSGPATVSGSTVTLIGVGTVVLAANQAGNANYNAADEVTASFVVSGESVRPDWTAPIGREFSMTVYAVVETKGQRIDEAGSMLAAFDVDGVLAGVAEPIDGPVGRLYVLTIWSDQTSLPGLELRVFDSARNEVVEIRETLDFEVNAILGQLNDPRVFQVRPPTIEQTIRLVTGWNWVSFNVEPEDPRVRILSASYTFSDHDVIKGTGGVATFYQGQWYPSNLMLDPGRMYMVRRQALGSANLVVEGVAADASKSLPLVAGWNWLGYLPQLERPISNALGGLSLQDGDLVKSQYDGSVTYYAGQWYPSNRAMVPGRGYLLKLSSTQTLSYDSAPSINRAMLSAKALQPTEDLSVQKEFAQQSSAPSWVAPNNREASAVVYAVVDLRGERVSAAGSLLAAFIDNDIAGVAALEDGPGSTKLFNLQVWADQTDTRKSITFKVYDTVSSEVTNVHETLVWEPNASFGRVDAPVALRAGVQDQTINSFSFVADRVFGDAAFAVTVPTASSGLSVVLSVKSGPATVSGNTVTLIGAGTVVLAANQAGNTNYNAAPEVTTSFTVGKGSQIQGAFPAVGAKTFGGAPFAVTLPSAGASGQPVVLSVKSGPATVSGNTVTLTGAGTVVLAANQAGNANYNAAAEVTVRFNVGKANQTISFTAPSSQKFKKNRKFTLSAGATSKLPVVFTSSNARIVRISGKTATIIGKGKVKITASQRGNANFNAAKAVTRKITIK